MAGHKAGRNLRRRHTGSRRAFGGHSAAIVVAGKSGAAFRTPFARQIDQPGPGRTGAAAGAAQRIMGVWVTLVHSPFSKIAEAVQGLGDSEGGRGLGRFGSFEHAA